MALTLPDLTDDLQQLLGHAIFFDPWLAALTENDLDPRLDLVLDEGLRALMLRFWTEHERARALDVLPVYDELVLECLRTCVLSTTCQRAVWDGLPRVPDEARLSAVLKDFFDFALQQGLAPIVRSSIGVLAYEHLLALTHYGGMREEDFLHGRLHRPWVTGTLSSELSLMLAVGSVFIEMRGGVRYVSLTAHGERRGRELGDQLRTAGYVRRRVQALYIAHFDVNTSSYDRMFDRFIPTLPNARNRLLDLFDPPAGAQVLELGSGTGIFTFETGLAQRVGPQGEVYALEPAQEMSVAARRRARERDMRNVRFVQGRAESAPFDDGQFDGVVGSLMLHFTDADQTLAEAFRVLRPGGTVAMLWMYAWDIRKNVPFSEWLAPLQALVQRPQESGFGNRRFLTLEQAEETLRSAGFIDIHTEIMALEHELWHVQDVVQATLALGLYQQEFEQLPWAARQDLIRDLYARGERTVRRYSRAELTVTNHAGLLVARRPDETGPHPRAAISLDRRRRRRATRAGGA